MQCNGKATSYGQGLDTPSDRNFTEIVGATSKCMGAVAAIIAGELEVADQTCSMNMLRDMIEQTKNNIEVLGPLTKDQSDPCLSRVADAYNETLVALEEAYAFKHCHEGLVAVSCGAAQDVQNSDEEFGALALDTAHDVQNCEDMNDLESTHSFSGEINALAEPYPIPEHIERFESMDFELIG